MEGESLSLADQEQMFRVKEETQDNALYNSASSLAFVKLEPNVIYVKEEGRSPDVAETTKLPIGSAVKIEPVDPLEDNAGNVSGNNEYNLPWQSNDASEKTENNATDRNDYQPLEQSQADNEYWTENGSTYQKIEVKKRSSVVSMPQKLEAVTRIEKGEPVSKVALEMGTSCRTIFKWKQQRREIEKWCSKMNGNRKMKDRRRMRKPMYQNVDEALFIWYNQRRLQGLPISGSIIRTQALKLYEEMGGREPFVASDGWLSNWKQRHGIRILPMGNGKLSYDMISINDFTKAFLKIVKEDDLTPDQVFNCSETGLNFRILPSKFLTPQSEELSPGCKKSEDRVTVLACSNASGSLKLPLVVIGASSNQKAFKNISTNHMPVFYRSQRSAVMEAKIFEEWFNLEFIPRVGHFLEHRGLPPKAILVLDDALPHPRSKDLIQEKIKTMFFSPDVAPFIQPMDQGVLEDLKRRYRYKLMSFILRSLKEGGNVIQHLKSFTLKNVIFWIADAWEEVDSDCIVKSWRKAWPRHDSGEMSREIGQQEKQQMMKTFWNAVRVTEGCENISEEDLHEWMNRGDDRGAILSDDEIITMVKEGRHQDNDGTEESPSVGDITNEEAINMCNQLVTFFHKKANLSLRDIQAFYRARDSCVV